MSDFIRPNLDMKSVQTTLDQVARNFQISQSILNLNADKIKNLLNMFFRLY